MSEKIDNSTEEWLQAGYRYAFSLTHNPLDAEDFVQQAWLKLTRHYGCVKNRSMLFTTVRNLFYDQCRREHIVHFEPLEDSPEWPVAETDTEWTLNSTDMVTILSVLRPPEREALYLNVVEGYTAKEIGRIMKISRNTVLSLIHRARKKLKKIWIQELK